MRAGDEAEFRRYAADRWTSLMRTAYLLTGDHGHAEDLTQTTLANAYASWPRVRRADNVDGYVRRMLVNANARRFRKRRVPEDLTDDVPTQAVDSDQNALAERGDLLRALATLPYRQRAVVVLRYWEDMSEVEVANLLGCSVGTVKSQASRALAKLRLSPALIGRDR
jgi:RNA polymerase sigma-70 factor (sigma-E family)